MRLIHVLTLAVSLGFLAGSAGRAWGDPFAAVGVVWGEKGSLARYNPIVSVFNRAGLSDQQINADGVYFLKVPKAKASFQLVYHASGHLPQLSKPIDNTVDPNRRDRVVLKTADPEKYRKDANLLREDIQDALFILERSEDQELKKRLLADLRLFAQQVLDDASVGQDVKGLLKPLRKE